jgi:hypothetical protein
MRIIKLITILVFIVLIFTSIMPAFAAPPPNISGKGPPEITKIVFIHYKNGFAPASPAGGSGKGPKGDTGLYSYGGIHWDKSMIPVSYFINLYGQPSNLSRSDMINGVKASFNTWEADERSSIDFNYAGETNLVPDTLDGTNVVGWGHLDKGVIAMTSLWYLPGRVIIDCDVTLNTDPGYSWTQTDIGANDPDGQRINDTDLYDVDIQNIMTHEAGHWLMLDDLYDQIASEQTMYGSAGDRELKKRSLESGDIAGVRYIYPLRGKNR